MLRVTAICLVLCIGDAACSSPGEATAAEPTAAAESAPLSAAERLLLRTVAFHDPEGLWGTRAVRVDWTLAGPDGGERIAVELGLGPGSEFSMVGTIGASTLDYRAEGSTWSAAVDGSPELSDEVRERLGLVREDGLFWRNYFRFLAGLPMVLTDPGVRVRPEPIESTFAGTDVIGIEVAFEPEVGGDTWTVYVHPRTKALVACSFHHTSPEDGEYIVFRDLCEVGGLRLPARRDWYRTRDDELLGTDTLAPAGATAP